MGGINPPRPHITGLILGPGASIRGCLRCILAAGRLLAQRCRRKVIAARPASPPPSLPPSRASCVGHAAEVVSAPRQPSESALAAGQQELTLAAGQQTILALPLVRAAPLALAAGLRDVGVGLHSVQSARRPVLAPRSFVLPALCSPAARLSHASPSRTFVVPVTWQAAELGLAHTRAPVSLPCAARRTALVLANSLLAAQYR
ncbi:hypothetical protein AURDEDRAFT_174581 [Auricularia subglabra TFB-10046 SS5]|uniref:Uncharacterized protein n=1 Tax=Auricularia subglabra (strain TFB-10046 / SS5) TaxID=717982 RepID=J0D9D0_AURST|nr:hypothetical protein AURDEDRAFT_174581 [Auricularia subglabra TFB-10046 SS5]